VFYEDENGETQGASEYSIARCSLLLEGEQWDDSRKR
jgi:hypothetical protein